MELGGAVIAPPRGSRLLISPVNLGLLAIPVLLVLQTAAAVPPSVVVLPLETSGVRQDLADSIGLVVPSEVRRLLPGAKVISGSEIATFMSLERQRQLLGCESDSSCVAEMVGALGVDEIVSGKLGKVGHSYVLEVRRMDARKGTVRGSVAKSITDLDGLVPTLEASLDELYRGSEPHHAALSWGLVAGGGLLALAGTTGLVWSLGVNQQYVDQQTPGATPQVTQADAARVKTLYPLSWAALAVGAAATTWGIMRLAGSAPAQLQVSFSPTPMGAFATVRGAF